MNRERQTETGLTQNAAFIRGAYRKAVVTGMLSILSTNINVFVDGILLGNRIGEDALAAINLSMPVYWVLCVVGSFFAAGTEIPAARAIGVGDATRRDAFFRTGFNASVVVSLVVTFLALTFRGPLSAFLCADEAIRPYVTQYNDLLTYVIRSGNITEELPGIPPLHLYLELGACVPRPMRINSPVDGRVL